QQICQPAVAGIETYRVCQPHERGAGLFEPLYASVGHRDMVSQRSGAQALAGNEALENGGSGNAMMVLKKQTGLFERSFLTGGLDIESNVFQWQDTRHEIH